MLNIGVLISGGGTNLQAIIDETKSGGINGTVKLVISNKENAYGLERARLSKIKAVYETDEDKIIGLLKENNIDLIVLAGYLSILDGDILKEFKDKIINIHPSLIPSFCGDKMYGIHIHNAVKACGVRFTGCTVHFVNEEVDGGAIILQEAVPVYFDDRAEDIQKRVLVEEHKLLPKAIDLISKDKIEIIDGRVNILK